MTGQLITIMIINNLMTKDFSLKITLLLKIFRKVQLGITDRIVFNFINTGLFTSNIQNQQQAHCTIIEYNYLKARLLSIKDLEREEI